MAVSAPVIVYASSKNATTTTPNTAAAPAAVAAGAGAAGGEYAAEPARGEEVRHRRDQDKHPGADVDVDGLAYLERERGPEVLAVVEVGGQLVRADEDLLGASHGFFERITLQFCIDICLNKNAHKLPG